MKDINFKFTIALGLLLACASCDKDKNNGPEASGNSAEIALITRVQNENGQGSAGYMQTLNLTDFSGTISNKNAHELSAKSTGGTYAFNKSIYINDYHNSNIARWTLSANNLAKKMGEINVSELGFQGNIAFKDANTAYVGGSGKIIIFNPTTMTKIGVIDWSSLSRLNEVTNFPDKDDQIKNEGISEIIINGNYLLAAMYHTKSDMFTPATKTCNILVVDLKKIDLSSPKNEKALVSIIQDDRGSFTGAWNSGGGVYFMQKVENGDIYVLCHNVFGGFRKIIGKPACLLRIKNGEKVFDKDYYFDLETAAGGAGNPVINFEYYGNGKFLASVMDPKLLNKDNPYSYNMDPIFNWWTFDLHAKTAKKISKENTRSGKIAKCYFTKDYAYVPFDNGNENYINKISLNDFSKKGQMLTTGLANILDLH
ncbi:DUF4374 domain-containing protein [Sphingobacterium sp. Mn56C]|uniref:DUF4374 domain-containing protein n=1 Tax=Sphingobacterium sp. Mn56C TaxID=3395261 RepID=UPI003BEC173A